MIRPGFLTFFLTVLVLQFFQGAAAALTAKDLLIVYNRAMPESLAVAEYYAAARKVPAANLLGFDLPRSESMTREQFESDLLKPLREKVILRLETSQASPALLLVYGVPLRVGPASDDAEEERLAYARNKETELAVLVDGLDQRLQRNLLPGASYESMVNKQVQHQSVEELLSRTTTRLQKATARQQPTPSPEVGRERAAVILSLVGLAAKDSPRHPEGASDRDTLAQWQNLLDVQLTAFSFSGITRQNAGLAAASVRVRRGALGELRFWHQQATTAVTGGMSSASVDSELSLLLSDDYRKGKWLPNPFLPGFDAQPGIAEVRQRTLMVARLDGPTAKIATRLVDDAMAVEAKGLTGTFYIDARGLNEDPQKKDAYAAYDEQLRKLYGFLRQRSTMQVILDNRPELFAGPVGDVALYCGWYALADYHDVFTWNQGAVGFHVASGEAKTLHDSTSNVWCKRMLEKGVAATLGPVEEPYLQAFPQPGLFFPLLLTGRWTLLETYYRSTPYLSWRLVLVGDPLYTPFRTHPVLIDSPPP